VFVLVYSKIFIASYFIILFIVINFSPISFGAAAYALAIVSQSSSSKKLELFQRFESTKMIKINFFFKGIFKYFFKSLGLTLILIVTWLFFYANIYFYWRVLTPKIPLLGLVLTGFMLWLTAVLYLMHFYLIPLLITKNISPFKALYQAFLLVADNILYTLSVGMLLTSLFVIMAFTVAGIFLIFYGAAILLQLFGFIVIYQKYDETLELSSEPRTLKDIIKPWG